MTLNNYCTLYPNPTFIGALKPLSIAKMDIHHSSNSDAVELGLEQEKDKEKDKRKDREGKERHQRIRNLLINMYLM